MAGYGKQNAFPATGACLHCKKENNRGANWISSRLGYDNQKAFHHCILVNKENEKLYERIALVKDESPSAGEGFLSSEILRNGRLTDLLLCCE